MASPARAEVISVGFGESLPPYCLPESDAGIEVDIFREALAHKGHRLEARFMPMKRISLEFIDGHLDGAMMDSGIDLSAVGGHYAEPAVIFDNVFITLSDRYLVIRKPDDLRGLSVQAFPGALVRYPEWLEPVAKAGHYAEIDDQYSQVQVIQDRRYDVVLSDRVIFAYHSRQVREKLGKPLRHVAMHNVFKADPRDYRAIFRSETVARDYEAGLAHLKSTGRYREIFDNYLKSMAP